jgi:hypothetical protein
MIVTSGVVKNREGLKDRATILWKADWQAGYKSLGQLEHFWLVIEHVMANCNSMIVWEGKCHSENELIAVLEQHNAIERGAGVIDCSFNTKHLLQFCYRNRFNAIMSNESWHGGFLHRADRVRRYYDEGSAICGKLNVNPVFPAIPTKDGWSPARKEPLVINVNKAGMIANHFFIREHKPRTIEDFKNRGLEAKPEHYIERIIPQDVSEEFRMQYDSWIRVGKDAKKRQDEVSIGGDRFQQIRPADHMLICLAGIDMLKDWSGLLGHRLTELRRIAQPEGENI